MKKLKLEIDFAAHARFLALVTAKPSHEVAWKLNEILALDFNKMKDLEVSDQVYACVFHAILDSHESDVFLFKQQTTAGLLLPRHKKIDYLLVEQNFEENFALDFNEIKNASFFDFQYDLEETSFKKETLRLLELV